jgi:hypothetical protein
VNTIRKATSLKNIKYCGIQQLVEQSWLTVHSLPVHLSIFASTPLQLCQCTSPGSASIPLALRHGASLFAFKPLYCLPTDLSPSFWAAASLFCVQLARFDCQRTSLGADLGLKNHRSVPADLSKGRFLTGEETEYLKNREVGWQDIEPCACNVHPKCCKQ